jgi:hypothetical protein
LLLSAGFFKSKGSHVALIGLSKPKQQNVSAALSVGDLFPVSNDFLTDKSYSVIAFLRHVGCPFAENSVKQLRDWAQNHNDVAVFVVSHGNAKFTQTWIESIGGLGHLTLVIDETRETYGRWGIGYSNLMHFLGFRSLIGVMALFLKGIHNRDACGTRWQKSAMFVVGENNVLWMQNPNSAEEFVLPPDHIFT